jgi:hypothetical protein
MRVSLDLLLEGLFYCRALMHSYEELQTVGTSNLESLSRRWLRVWALLVVLDTVKVLLPQSC